MADENERDNPPPPPPPPVDYDPGRNIRENGPAPHIDRRIDRKDLNDDD